MPHRPAMSARYNTTISRVLFNTVFFSGILVWTCLFILLSPVLWGRQFFLQRQPVDVALRILIHNYGYGCCAIMKALVPLRVSVFFGHIPEPCIIIPNHQSFFDPYCLGVLPIKNLVFAVRSWPFRIPLYGPMMRRAGYLNAETMDADALFREAKALLQSGCTIIMYPEGTRSPDGALGRFRAGAFKLAMETGVPIVPLCMDGTGKVFPKGQRFGQIAPVRISLLQPVLPQDFAQYGEAGHLRLRRHVKAVMNNTLEGSSHSLPDD